MDLNNGLCVRIVTADYYLTVPKSELKDVCYSEFRSTPVSRVPVIRIFGPTIDGRKACVHIHGVFPYIFVPNWFSELLDQDLYQLAASIDKAINLSLGNSSSNSQYVYKIVKVLGRPFYGYHVGEKQFLKIFFYNPNIIKRAADLLQSGAILNRVFQPHEAHIPFVLQFFIDNNLYGMSFIKLSSFKLRQHGDISELEIGSGNNSVPKQSFSELELDAEVSNIINTYEDSGKISSNPGLYFIWEEEKKRRGEQETDLDITPNVSQLRPETRPSRTETYFKKKLVEKFNRLEDSNNLLRNPNSVQDASSTSMLVNEETILNLSQINTSLNSSFSEFNSQGRSVLFMLQNLMRESDEQSNQPQQHLSKVEEPSLFGTQPLLQLFADDDSILGILPVSDGSDVDENDHLILSQSIISSDENKFSKLGTTPEKYTEKPIPKLGKMNNLPNAEQGVDDEFNLADLNERSQSSDNRTKIIASHSRKQLMPQLDGVDDSDSEDSEGEGINTEINKRSDSSNNRYVSSGNGDQLNAKQQSSPIFDSVKRNNHSKKLETKRSPKRSYPQLEISIQKSPSKLLKDVSRSTTPVIMSQLSDPALVSSKLPMINLATHSKSKRNKSAKRCLKKMPLNIDCVSESEIGTEEIEDKRNSKVEDCESWLDQRDVFYDNEKASHNKRHTKPEIATNPNKLHLLQNPINSNELDSSLDLLKWKRRKRKKVNEKVPPLELNQCNCENSSSSTLNDNNSGNNQEPDHYVNKSEHGASELSNEYDSSVIQISKGDHKQPEFQKCLTLKMKPPTRDKVVEVLTNQNLPIIPTKEPFYSNPTDATVGKNICGKLIKVGNKSIDNLQEFKGYITCGLEFARSSIFKDIYDVSQSEHLNSFVATERVVVLGPVKPPPTFLDAVMWLKSKTEIKQEEKHVQCALKYKMPIAGSVSVDGSDSEDTDNEITHSLSASVSTSLVSLGTPQISSQNQSCVKYKTFMKKLIHENEKNVENISDTFDMNHTVVDHAQTLHLNTQECQKSQVKPHDKNDSSHHLLFDARYRNNLIGNLSEETSSPSFKIGCATPDNTCNFKMELQNLQDLKDDAQYQYITAMSLELFIKTRGNLKPDPEYDEVNAVFFSILNDAPDTYNIISGVIAIENNEVRKRNLNGFHADITYVENEMILIDCLISVIRKSDPDMLIGYEIEMLSWGYLIQRSKYLNRNVVLELSRIKEKVVAQEKPNPLADLEYDEIKIIGRILLNVWRFMRHEVTLQSYTFENVLYHVLHQRVPLHSNASLTIWWDHPLYRHIVADYYLLRTECTLQILQQLDFLGRTSELARLFGIQFYEVLSRGSQFRVESMMLRMAKPQNYVAVSPSIRQRAAMRAPESLPLIMEPESRFYSDPVIVLDFQSLYPSIIIAYNYCFSTCLGRVQYLGQSEPFEFGCLQHFVPVDILKQFENNLNISPCGVAFVDKSIQSGILPAMLEEILETRILVKKSMKKSKNDKLLQRVLHSRQLGLKLIANVTYGYTAANFSGRMPCIEVGDSVVSKGRETLEQAIELIGKTEKWKAKVIYGDTDSIFVLVPGRTKQEAFQIGTEIANTVTNNNPKPVKLKLEKIYQPCILQTKKRYVGYMYESEDQQIPVYNAKGIETVRRDGCPAASKILEKSLKLLFDTCDISLIKRYVQRQFSKLISGRISIQDLIFAREYRGMKGYKPGACVPALQLARAALTVDRRAEPRPKERVRYIIIAGPPGVPLIQLVRTPEQVLSDVNLRINSEYYITRVIIPALDRCFTLLAVNVFQWYMELPRKQQLYLPNVAESGNVKIQKKSTISQYFLSLTCVACHRLTNVGLCEECIKNPQSTVLTLSNLSNIWQRKHNYITKLCQSCCGRSVEIDCKNLDCDILYQKQQSMREVEQVSYLEELKDKFFGA